MNLTDLIHFTSPLLFVVILPLLALLLMDIRKYRKKGIVSYTGLEYLTKRKHVSGIKRKHLRFIILFIVIILSGLLWMNPVTYSSNPVFGGATQINTKQFVVVFDMSPSMNLTMGDITEDRIRGLTVNEVGVTKYEVAREALFGFLERFKGNSFGLILFSTEPFLARWPTVETDTRFLEVLDDSLRRGSGSQLEAYSGLTNTDQALLLARDVIHSSATANVRSSAVILIADAWDEVEAVEAAIREIRNDGINLYIIGTGVPEDIIEKLTDNFLDDTGFRIFHVDSEAEMAQAYYLIGNIEESDTFAIDERFETNIRWLIAFILAIFSIFMIWALEIPLHRSFSHAARKELIEE